MAKILWIDSSPHYNHPYIWRLERRGHEVITATTCMEGEEKLNNDDWDIVLFEVMIDRGKGSEEKYPISIPISEKTSGEMFFERMRKTINEKDILPISLSINAGTVISIADNFIELGLPAENILSKIHLMDTKEFIKVIEERLKQKREL